MLFAVYHSNARKHGSKTSLYFHLWPDDKQKKQKHFIYNFNTDYLKADTSNWQG